LKESNVRVLGTFAVQNIPKLQAQGKFGQAKRMLQEYSALSAENNGEEYAGLFADLDQLKSKNVSMAKKCKEKAAVSKRRVADSDSGSASGDVDEDVDEEKETEQAAAAPAAPCPAPSKSVQWSAPQQSKPSGLKSFFQNLFAPKSKQAPAAAAPQSQVQCQSVAEESQPPATLQKKEERRRAPRHNRQKGPGAAGAGARKDSSGESDVEDERQVRQALSDEDAQDIFASKKASYI